ncbi:MAG: relaxase/mobilization nuclease domain-containing protein [Acutalibacteraceae bacterium]|nr:relaxase/mobilization nuclease domain-containing protein [Acutalibacteraceae bacterium]
MATIIYIPEVKQSISAMKGVIDYCTQDKKVYDNNTNQRLVSGINCDGENALKEFIATKRSYDKTNGMNFYQYVQSFSPEENISHQKAHELALEFAEKAWTGYEVLVATHCEAEHIHSHFVINSVSFESGKKLRQNPNTLKTLRALSDEICRKHNLSTLKPYEKDGTKLSSREYRTAVQGQSWKIKLMCDIDKAMEFSGSKEEFIQAMSVMGYSVIWTDDRKYITYQCPNKMKCRDIKLHEDKYLKGNIENEFRYRQEKYYRKSKTEEQQLTDFNRASVRRNESDCDSLPGQRGRAQFIENGSEVSTRAVQYDFKNFNRRPDGGISGENSGNQQRQYENNLTELSDRVEESFGTDSERSQIYTDSDYKNFRTGWEESRAVFERHLAERAGTLNANIITDKNSELYDIPEMVTHNSGIFNGINSLVESFSRIIVDDSEDEDERRKRIEAEQNGSALGTAIGFVAGVIAGAISNTNIKDDEYDLSKEPDENYNEEIDKSPTINL